MPYASWQLDVCMLQWTQMFVTMLQVLVQTKFEILGTWLKKEQWSKGAIKGGSHFNLSLCCQNNANKNDVIVLWKTFVTCSYLSHNHCFYKRTKKYFI
jgi:hypothetical protein